MNFGDLIAKGGALFARKGADALADTLETAPPADLARIQASVSGDLVTILAGVKSAPTSEVLYVPRADTISGWASAYVSDPDFAFDRVSLPNLTRAAGLTGGDRWATVVVEVLDLSYALDGALLIAKSSVAVDPAADSTGPLTFALTDPAGRPIVLHAGNLPRRFLVRYYAINSSGTPAVCGDVMLIEHPLYAMRTKMNQSGDFADTGNYSFYRTTAGTWTVNGGYAAVAFTFVLAGQHAVARPPGTEQVAQNALARFGHIRNGATTVANVLVIGDSWTHAPYRLSRPLTRALIAKYGDAGPGWVGVTHLAGGVYAGTADDAKASISRSGSWVDDIASPHGLDAYSCTAGSVGDTITITIGGTARRGVLHGRGVSGGGSVRWAINGGSWATISLDGSGTVIAPMDFGSELTGAGLVIEVLSLGAGVTLHGVDLRRDTAGVRVHKFGHPGGQAGDNLAVPEAVWFSELASINPTAAVMLWTTNEIHAGTPAATMVSNMEGIMRRLRQVRPYIDFVVVIPFGNLAEETSNLWTDYRDALLELARKWQCPVLDTHSLIGSWGNAVQRGLVEDTVPHPSAACGQILAGTLVREYFDIGL